MENDAKAIERLGDELARTVSNRNAVKEQLVADLNWTDQHRLDAIADSKKLEMVVVDGITHIRVVDGIRDKQGNQIALPADGFKLSDHAKRQVAEKCTIPMPFYERLETKHPDLLATNVNRLIGDRNALLLRTVNQRLMGVLSDKFNILDNKSAMAIAIAKATQYGAELWDAKLTDTSLFAKFVIPNRVYDVSPRTTGKDFVGRGGQRGDYLAAGVQVSNSEWGCRSLRADIFFLRLECMNGMVRTNVMRTVHLGKRNDFGLVSHQTKQLENAALWSGLGDVIGNVFSDNTTIESLVAKMRGSAEVPVTKPVEAMEYVQENYGLPKDAVDALLTNFANDQVCGATLWGVANAVTAYAKSQTSYDQQVSLEELGMKLLDDRQLLKVVA
jgi:hypothetical protein